MSEQQPKIWFTSDLHFGHNAIIKFSNRPYSNVYDMNLSIIDIWNSKVSQSDHVYHLGDFCWYADKKDVLDVIKKLNGNIHFILGNHDQVLEKNKNWLMSSTRGKIKEISTYKEIAYNGHKVVLFHYPIGEWHGYWYNAWNLHGHCHGRYTRRYGKQMDVGFDTIDHPFMSHTLFSFEDIKIVMDRNANT